MDEDEIEYKGQTYHFSRSVTGKQKFRQTITVHGVGSKEDSAVYSRSGGHPIESMAGTARLIAHEVLMENVRE